MNRRFAIKLLLSSFISINIPFIKKISLNKKKIVNNWLLNEADI